MDDFKIEVDVALCSGCLMWCVVEDVLVDVVVDNMKAVGEVVCDG